MQIVSSAVRANGVVEHRKGHSQTFSAGAMAYRGMTLERHDENKQIRWMDDGLGVGGGACGL
jgi:hypothetical protein